MQGNHTGNSDTSNGVDICEMSHAGAGLNLPQGQWIGK